MTFSMPKTECSSGTKNKHGHSAGRKGKQIAHQSDLWIPKRRQNTLKSLKRAIVLIALNHR
jgi:hypothetical protein